MKKIIIILVLLSVSQLMAQRKVSGHIRQLIDRNCAFKTVHPFYADSHSAGIVDTLVRKATYAKLAPEVSKDIFINRHEYIELEIPYDGAAISIQLYRVMLHSDDFTIRTTKGIFEAYAPGAYYRGIIKDNPNSIASFSFFEDRLFGIVSSPAIGNITVGRIETAGNSTDYVIYSDTDLLIPQAFECSAPETGKKFDTINKKSIHSENCVSLYFELMHNAYEANGNDVAATANWFTALFNNVQTLFDNDGISTGIKSIYVWDEQDPYNLATQSAYGLLDQFAAQTPVFEADAGQLINYGGGNGLAYEIGALCTDYNRSYAKVNPNYQPLPAYSPAVKMIAHELGHTFGSHHTHGCYWNGNNTAIDGCSTGEGDCVPGPIPSGEEGGTIMSYCGNINFANGFGPQPRQRILDHIAASGCLGTDCINSCTNTISALNLTDTSMSSANLSWTDASSGPWEIGFAPYGTPVTQWQESLQNTFHLNGLSANTYYTFSVRNKCSDGATAGAKILSFSTGADWCAGDLWSDTGGTGGNYTEAQHTVTIIKPQLPDHNVSVTFENFWTQLNDIVYIYDGVGTTAPMIGEWSGYTEPGTAYTATNPSGALTFEFVTDRMVYPSEGWTASVACTVMGITENPLLKLTCHPNPVKKMLTLTNINASGLITLYNPAGQLLARKVVASAAETLDMSACPSGVYIIKVECNGSHRYLRVLKE
ncbi:M12 family metallo-peptidase [uncultured Flavobacterium sp.]|uniref:M12 family metallo-peptidase n=1 Tax=uncultured Flavobacterium sp. TaxID=165435 RepID=UPI0025EE80AF|nr:M12 family metallo-peptidase [uncultured Flavobacterium sp.]